MKSILCHWTRVRQEVTPLGSNLKVDSVHPSSLSF